MFKRIKDSANAVIEFRMASPHAPIGTSEFSPTPSGTQHGVRQVKEERSFLVALNEVKSFVGVDSGQFVNLHRRFTTLPLRIRGTPPFS